MLKSVGYGLRTWLAWVVAAYLRLAYGAWGLKGGESARRNSLTVQTVTVN